MPSFQARNTDNNECLKLASSFQVVSKCPGVFRRPSGFKLVKNVTKEEKMKQCDLCTEFSHLSCYQMNYALLKYTRKTVVGAVKHANLFSFTNMLVGIFQLLDYSFGDS